MGWSRSWLLAAVLAAVLVVPWQQQRLVASQGLNVAPATLGAGAQATATEFEVGLSEAVAALLVLVASLLRCVPATLLKVLHQHCTTCIAATHATRCC
jgi:hypothetical protein